MSLTRPRLGQILTNVASLTDSMTVINSAATQANVDVGFIFNRADGVGSVPNVALYWSESLQSFAFVSTNNDGAQNVNLTPISYANITANYVLANTVSTNSLVYANGAPYNFTTYTNSNVASYLPMYAGALTASTITTTSNAAIGGNLVVSYTPSSVGGAGIQVSGSGTQGGTSYFDFLKTTITYSGSTNPNKFFRLDSTGTIQIINSAYTNNIFNLTDAGDLTVPGKVTGGNIITTNGVFFANGQNYATLISAAIGTYSNANVSGYLPGYTGLLSAGNITSTGYGYFGGVFNEASTTGGVFIGNTGSGTPSPRIGFFNGTASQNWQIDNFGGSFRWFTPGVTRMTLDAQGNLSIPSTTTSTSNTTGALQVAGGVGIGGNLYVGGNLVVTGTQTFLNTETVTTTEYVSTINATNLYAATIGNTGAAHVGATVTASGAVTAGNLITTNGLFWANGVAFASSTYGNANVAAYLPTYTGNLTAGNINVSGYATFGTGQGGALFRPIVGGTQLALYNTNVTPSQTNYSWLMDGSATTINSVGGLYLAYQNNVIVTVNGTQLSVGASTTSTSSTTGALVVTGGAGIGGNLNAGSNSVSSVQHQLLSGAQFAPTVGTFLAGAHTVHSGAGGNYLAMGQYPSGSANQYGQWLQSGYPATSGAVYYPLILNPLGGNVVVGATTTSTSNTTGALTVAGGVGIGGNLYVGGNLVVTGTQTFLNTETVSTTEYVATINATNVYASTIGNTGAALTGATVTATGAVTAGNLITTNGLFWANGVAFASSTYSNANVQSYLAANTDPTISNLNANAAVQATALNTINANLGSYQTWANANVSSLQSQVTASNANIGSFYTWANTNFGTSNYANANVAAYLPTYAGNLSANIITASGNIVITSNTPTVNANTGALVVQGGMGVSGNIFVAGNLVGTYTNVTVTSGAYTTTFDPYGNITLPAGNLVIGNVFANYIGNATTVLSGIGSGISGVAANQLAGTANTAAVSLQSFLQPSSSTGIFYLTFGNVTGGNAALLTASSMSFQPSSGNLTVQNIIASSNYYGTIATQNQPQITGLGNLNTLSVGNVTTLYGNTVIANATTSTSATTGALVIPTGGIGVGGQSYFNGLTSFAGGLKTATIASSNANVNLYGDGVTGNINIGATSSNVYTGGNLTAGNLLTINGLYWANGVSYVTSITAGFSVYSNSNVVSYFASGVNGNININNGYGIYYTANGQPYGYGNTNVQSFLQSGSLANVRLGNAFIPGNLTVGNITVQTISYTNQEIVTLTDLIQGNLVANATQPATGANTGAIQVPYGGIWSSGNIITGQGIGVTNGIYWTGNGAAFGYSNVTAAAYLTSAASSVTATLGNVISGGFYWANGTSYGSSIVASLNVYANANVQAFMPVYAGNISANVISANAYTWAANGVSALYGNTDMASFGYRFFMPGFTGNLQAGNLLVANTAGYGGNITTGNILSSGYFWANGAPFITSNYGNANVAAYLPTYTGFILGSQIRTFANANVGGNLMVYGDSYMFGNATISGNLTVANITYLNQEFVTTSEVVTGNLVANSGTASGNVSTGALVVVGGAGVSGNIFTTGNVYTNNRVGFTYSGNSTSVVYQIYNSATSSLDTVFG